MKGCILQWRALMKGIDGGFHPAVDGQDRRQWRALMKGIDGGLHPAVEVLMEGYILQWMY